MYSKHQRYEGIKRNYTPETVERLRGSLKIEYTLAKRGTMKLWNYLTRGGNSYINAMGALTGKKTLPCLISQPTDSPISILTAVLVLTARESHSLSPKYGECYNVARNLLGGLPEWVWHAPFREFKCPYNFFSLVYQQKLLNFFSIRVFTATSTQKFEWRGNPSQRANELWTLTWKSDGDDARCDSTTFHSISLQKLRMYVKEKPQ